MRSTWRDNIRMSILNLLIVGNTRRSIFSGEFDPPSRLTGSGQPRFFGTLYEIMIYEYPMMMNSAFELFDYGNWKSE